MALQQLRFSEFCLSACWSVNIFKKFILKKIVAACLVWKLAFKIVQLNLDTDLECWRQTQTNILIFDIFKWCLNPPQMSIVSSSAWASCRIFDSCKPVFFLMSRCKNKSVMLHTLEEGERTHHSKCYKNKDKNTNENSSSQSTIVISSQTEVHQIF